MRAGHALRCACCRARGWTGRCGERLDVAGITADSRQVAPGALFAALPGAAPTAGAFIADAVARGAVAVLAPDGTDGRPACRRAR